VTNFLAATRNREKEWMMLMYPSGGWCSFLPGGDIIISNKIIECIVIEYMVNP
jgi:hypothetical protein